MKFVTNLMCWGCESSYSRFVGVFDSVVIGWKHATETFDKDPSLDVGVSAQFIEIGPDGLRTGAPVIVRNLFDQEYECWEENSCVVCGKEDLDHYERVGGKRHSVSDHEYVDNGARQKHLAKFIEEHKLY